jgi:hypothetical protein
MGDRNFSPRMSQPLASPGTPAAKAWPCPTLSCERFAAARKAARLARCSSSTAHRVFTLPARSPTASSGQFNTLIGKIAAQGSDRQHILEHFKSSFANAAGITSSWSSNAGWAETNLFHYMENAANNAPLFIEAFYEGCVSLNTANPDIFVPDAAMINRALAEHDAGYEIQPPDLAEHERISGGS